MSNRSTFDDYIQLLEAGANLTQSARLGLINLLLTMACSTAAQVGNVTLIQGNITPLNVGSSFPHIVKLNGALSAEDETCEWQQYKTKTTQITIKLQDELGAPPPQPCPHASRYASRLVYT
jgi:hypothetical protein